MKKNRSQCPINFSVEIIGDKWTMLILRDIILMKKKTFGELKNSGEGIATNILTARLNFLTEEGILLKEKDPANSKVYFYTLTPKGIDLIPLLLDLAVWGGKYDKNTAAPKHVINKIITQRDQAIKEVVAAMNDPEKSIFKK